MGAFRHRWALAGVGVVCCAVSCGYASGSERPAPGSADTPKDLWTAAVAARQAFEAEPSGTHTKPEYAHVMEGFRAIYHGHPRDVHAARAAEQIAELLAEQGREFSDRKSLHDAAGQYVFVAHSYPGGARAADALLHAAELLAPNAANDPVEARAVREELASEYPDAAPATAIPADAPAKQSAPLRLARPVTPAAPAAKAAETPASAPAAVATSSYNRTVPSVVPVVSQFARAQPATSAHIVDLDASAVNAEVSGIRHWSTSTYTRVAIDLGGEVQYQAARVESPDRIFFDLHHAHLAPQLAGKSFAVTDDGFLTRIRAAQYSDDVTRVVLDVHEVTEYSAFLLPNPYRLIIDIHGKQDGGSSEEAGNRKQIAASSAIDVPASREQGSPVKLTAPVTPAPASETTAHSVLPPMPVTDGSAGFGLPAKSGGTAATAEPRVVISSKPTSTKPVPNSVTTKSDATGTEVAAVSAQSGKVEATSHPTSAPIVSRIKVPGTAQSSASSNTDSDVAEVAKLDHYRKPVHRSAIKTDPAPSQEEIDAAGRGAALDLKKTNGNDESAARIQSVTSRSVRHESVAGVPANPPPPTADGETSLMRALGLKIGRIVIDAGHGGHDSGTLGAGGIEEKDVVLDVALRLGKLLHDRLGAEIVYTRADDTFIPLETRTAIANKAQADLFISVHANSSPDTSARGVEVYYLNFTSDPDAMRVAGRENAVSTQSVHELSDLVKKIALKDKIDESRELATDVDESLYGGLTKGAGAKDNEGLRNRGVKKAPFVVLIGANMPSILAEISFVTNPTDADELRRPEYRERVAESIYGGVARYAGAINGSKPKGAATERAQRE